MVYILLSGDLIGKATKIGLKIPSDIKDFLEKVESEIRSAGKVTLKSVSSAVDNVMSTIKVAIAIPFIIFGAFLLLNPSLLAGLFISAVAIEASAKFFLAINPGWFSQKKGSKFKRDQESDLKKLDMSHES
ncbi:hypothetical protein [Paenibacillus sp. FSL P4-0288]|uniref:hypothetical protein n=1 Tax=Paenibacillus sp. FSL P4-0288 TaxID=2921633 RepID=UPI0030FB918C